MLEKNLCIFKIEAIFITFQEFETSAHFERDFDVKRNAH